MINLFNSLFRDENRTRNQAHTRPYTPALSRKIADTEILPKIVNKHLKKYENDADLAYEGILLNSCVLIYNICGEVPNLIDNLVD